MFFTIEQKMSPLLSFVSDRCLDEWVNTQMKNQRGSRVRVALGPTPGTARRHSSHPCSQLLTLSVRLGLWNDPDSEMSKVKKAWKRDADGSKGRN